MSKYFYILTAVFIAIYYFQFSERVSDHEKLSYFETSCKKATETIFSEHQSDKIALEYFPVSGVMGEEYYPTTLAKTLLSGSERFGTVQLLYDSDDLSPTRVRTHDYCEGNFLIEAHNPDQVELGLCGIVNAKEYRTIRQSKKTIADYIVQYRYGKRNKYDVREFFFLIIDYSDGKIIASQKSYQLLLGNMKEKENRVWKAWGGAEGAKSCALTSPKDFITKAISPNTSAANK